MFLDRISEYISRRRGLPTMVAIAFVAVNLILQFIPGIEGFAHTNLLLHLGIIIGFAGMLLSAALG